MRTHTLATLLALVGTLGLGACDKKDDEADAKKTDAKAADAKAADAKAAEPKAEVKADEPKADDAAPADGGGEAAGLGVMELSTLGLVAEAPADTRTGDPVVGDGVMVQGPELIATVALASDAMPKTEEEATKAAGDYTPKNLKAEALDDGFAITFDNEGGLGTNYFVQVRREIGGKAYWCETTASTPEQQANALAFCKSLKE